jgi:hypothetical protein
MRKKKIRSILSHNGAMHGAAEMACSFLTVGLVF